LSWSLPSCELDFHKQALRLDRASWAECLLAIWLDFAWNARHYGLRPALGWLEDDSVASVEARSGIEAVHRAATPAGAAFLLPYISAMIDPAEIPRTSAWPCLQ
jgi:hypothetical protein